MTTRAQYLTQIKTENPAENETTCEAWATMKLEQDIFSDAETAKVVAREALLDKLGITAEEAQLLLGGM